MTPGRSASASQPPYPLPLSSKKVRCGPTLHCCSSRACLHTAFTAFSGPDGCASIIVPVRTHPCLPGRGRAGVTLIVYETKTRDRQNNTQAREESAPNNDERRVTDGGWSLTDDDRTLTNGGWNRRWFQNKKKKNGGPPRKRRGLERHALGARCVCGCHLCVGVGGRGGGGKGVQGGGWRVRLCLTTHTHRPSHRATEAVVLSSPVSALDHGKTLGAGAPRRWGVCLRGRGGGTRLKRGLPPPPPVPVSAVPPDFKCPRLPLNRLLTARTPVHSTNGTEVRR